jgi:hypothetical protein
MQDSATDFDPADQCEPDISSRFMVGLGTVLVMAVPFWAVLIWAVRRWI